jgi:hypothetical protein
MKIKLKLRRMIKADGKEPNHIIRKAKLELYFAEHIISCSIRLRDTSIAEYPTIAEYIDHQIPYVPKHTDFE